MAKRQFNIRDTLIVVAVLSGCFVVGLFGYLRRERQENTIAAFSSTVQDPAGYWGESSVSVAVSSDQVDRIVWNGMPDDLSNGYVVMAMWQGQVMFFLIRADGTMNVNGRAFSTFPSRYGERRAGDE